MTIPATTALRAALVTTLRGNAALTALTGGQPRVFDHASERLPLPFVSIRTDDTQSWDTTTDRGEEITVEFNTWSNAEGRKEPEAVLNAIKEALMQFAPRTLTDHRLVNFEWKASRVIPDEQGQRYFGFQRWRAVTEEI